MRSSDSKTRDALSGVFVASEALGIQELDSFGTVEFGEIFVEGS